MDEKLLERTVETDVIHQGGYLTFRVDTVEDADGGRHKREIVVHPGAVAIVPLDGDDLLLVRQFRTPADRILLEIPAGKLDRGPDGVAEPAEAAAGRELREETGYNAARWRRLGSFFTAPGFTTEELTLFLAQELSEAPEGAHGDEGERVELARVPWRRALAMAQAGEIQDAKTLIGIFWLARLVDAGEL